jgi:hypothetical protein
MNLKQLSNRICRPRPFGSAQGKLRRGSKSFETIKQLNNLNNIFYPFLMSVLSRQSGNVIIMVVLLSMMAVTFFVFLMGYSLRSIEQVHNLENSVIAYYAAEGAVERSMVEYFNQLATVAPTINEQENICTGFTELGEAIVDFFNCPAGDYLGTLDRKATRYRNSVEGFLDKNEITEFWFTDSENESIKTLDLLQSIKVNWNTFNLATEQAGMEIILARWPKTSPQNVQTGRITLEPRSGNTYFYVKEFLPPDNASRGAETDAFDPGHYNYILFLKALNAPTHYRLTGLDNIIGNDSPEHVVALPTKILTVLSKAIIEDKRDFSKSITRSLVVEKEIYSEFDSNFEYSRHGIEL